MANVARVLKSMVPPLLWNIGSRLKRRMVPSTTLLKYAPNGWATPLTGNSSGDEFWAASVAQEQAVCETLIARVCAGEAMLHPDTGQHSKHAIFGYVMALAARHQQTISVLDYGGNVGDYYWLARGLVPDIELDYHCKEIPQIADIGRRVTPAVTWHTDNACLDCPHDLVMFSSSIQCLPDWREVLRRAAQSTRAYLFLSDVAAVHSVPAYVATHRSGGRMHLQILMNRTEIIRTVEETGLRLVREFRMGAHPPIDSAPEQPTCFGWLFERRRL